MEYLDLFWIFKILQLILSLKIKYSILYEIMNFKKKKLNYINYGLQDINIVFN